MFKMFFAVAVTSAICFSVKFSQHAKSLSNADTQLILIFSSAPVCV